VGNIAESDDDYDDEDQSNGIVSPRKRSSKKIKEPAIVVSQTLFSKTPVINPQKKMFQSSTNSIFQGFKPIEKKDSRRKNSHDNAGSSSSDAEEIKHHDDSFIDIDVDEDKDRAQS
jgi:hypothetical protein